VCALLGCKPAPHFSAPMTLGGKVVSAEVLNEGERVYTQTCRACHGEAGEGNGPASKGLRPPPRNFTKGIFKFGGTLPREDAPTLPRDEDFRRIIKGGLHGSAMISWDLPDAELDAVIQYVKTFSPKWQKELPGDPLVPSSDPWAEKHDEGVKLGRILYHSVAQCSSCHPGFASKQEIYEESKQLKPESPTVEFREDLFHPSPTDSMDYSLDGKHPLRIMPPDFTQKPLRSVVEKTALSDLYRVISLGINGAAMPPWRESLTEEQIWALSHYVKSLMDVRGTPEADVLYKRNIRASAKWTPPGTPDAGAPEKK
jgi:mono/diheme cytochrome c family protein